MVLKSSNFYFCKWLKLIEAFTHATEKGKEIAMTTAERLREEGKFYMMLDMIRNARKNGLSDDMIAKIVNLDLSSVKKVINNEAIDIPLHLLENRD
jgi:predicted transposase YdaD